MEHYSAIKSKYYTTEWMNIKNKHQWEKSDTKDYVLHNFIHINSRKSKTIETESSKWSPHVRAWGGERRLTENVRLWELDHRESSAPKNGCLLTVVLEKALKSPLDGKEIQPVNPKGNQSWIFIGSTDAEAETPILWPPDVKSRLNRKDPDAGKDWRWEVKGTTEDEMFGWHHQLKGHEFEPTPGGGEGQGSLLCWSP